MPARKDFVPGEFCWIDFSAHDLEAAIAWYGEMFGWTHMTMETPGGGPPYGFFLQGEAAIGGVGQMDEAMMAQSIPPTWNNYVNTADCKATEARVKKLGGTVLVPTTEVPGHGKLAFFQDLEGASFAAWQTLGNEGPGVLVREPVSMSWSELMTRDSSKAATFYSSLFGWDYAALPTKGGEYTLIKSAGKDAGGLTSMTGAEFEGIPAHWLVHFAVASCRTAAAKAEKTGGGVIVPPAEMPIGKFSVLGDPQGGVFAVIELNPSS